MESSRLGWRLALFEERLDDWIEIETPPDDVRRTVTSWILSRMDDPFDGARSEPAFENLWYAVVPGSIHAPQSVVACSYWLDMVNRVVTCDQIATLGHPA